MNVCLCVRGEGEGVGRGGGEVGELVEEGRSEAASFQYIYSCHLSKVVAIACLSVFDFQYIHSQSI